MPSAAIIPAAALASYLPAKQARHFCACRSRKSVAKQLKGTSPIVKLCARILARRQFFTLRSAA